MGLYNKNEIKVDIGSYRHYWRGIKKVGKAQPLYSKVQTPSGEKEIGSLKVGDEVFTIDGTATKVVGVFPQGKKPIYEIEFTDGSKTRCSDEHLWTFRTRKMKFLKQGFNRTLSLNEIMKANWKTFEIPVADAVEFEEKELPLDPYLLGLLIGDGSLVGNTVSFSNVEGDVLDRLGDKVALYNCSVKKNSEKNCGYTIKKPEFEYKNPIKSILEGLGLFGLYSKEKIVPEIYKLNSYENRLALLRGLMDTDGSVSVDGQLRFNTASPSLATDVRWLVQSLGGIATIHEDKREGKESFYVILRMPEGLIPVTSEKHLKRFGGHNPNMCKFFRSIEKVGEEECVCIKVEDESELYLTDEFIVTHNTTMYRDLILEEYGDSDKGLLISMGNENGYKALDNLTYVEANNWEKFEEIADDLVLNKKENSFHLIAFDTVDELVAITVDYAMRLHKSRTGKDAKSLNEVFGGYGAGRAFVTKQINNQITRLENAGYGLVFIGHTKLKDIKETAESDGYQQLTSNLSTDYDGIFADKADVLATFYTKRIVKNGILEDKERYIYFRNEGFIDCGSRFTGMPDKVEMSAKNYLKAFEQGVLSSMAKKLSPDELARKKELEAKEKQERGLKYSASEDFDPSSGMEKMQTLKDEIVQLYNDLGGKTNAALPELFKQYDPTGNPYRIKDVLKLEELRNKLVEMKKENN